MYVARILYPVKVLGPGNRIGIWFCGCPRRCKGCSNPELWEKDEKYQVSIDTVVSLIKEIASANPVDGFTITGGDPFYQYDNLVILLEEIKSISSDILVYTGYKIEELHDKNLSDIAVLIDGEYIEELNEGLNLIGSSNQKIHYLKSGYEEKYKEYINGDTLGIQNFNAQDGVISVGIHKRGFKF